MTAIDTNLLIYAHREWLPESSAARKAIDAASVRGEGWGISVQCVAEFWAVATNRRLQGRPSQVGEVLDFFAGLAEGGMRVFYPKAGFAERLAASAAAGNITGRRIFDLQIALTAREGGAREIWTHDREFPSVPGLAVAHPI